MLPLKNPRRNPKVTHTVIKPWNKKNAKLIRDRLKQRSNTPLKKKKVKDLDEDEVCSELISKTFKDNVDSTKSLMMHG